MNTTARFALPLIAPGQAQKEAYHNEALAAIDAALHPCVEGAPLAEPPIDPAEGQTWLVAADAVDDWIDRDDSLATWTAGGWRFTAPLPGMTVWTSGHWLHWSGASWTSGWPVESLLIDGTQIVGPRQPSIPSPSGGTTIDAEARAAIDLLTVTLRTHGLIE